MDRYRPIDAVEKKQCGANRRWAHQVVGLRSNLEDIERLQASRRPNRLIQRRPCAGRSLQPQRKLSSSTSTRTDPPTPSTRSSRRRLPRLPPLTMSAASRAASRACLRSFTASWRLEMSSPRALKTDASHCPRFAANIEPLAVRWPARAWRRRLLIEVVSPALCVRHGFFLAAVRFAFCMRPRWFIRKRSASVRSPMARFSGLMFFVCTTTSVAELG